MTKSRKTSRAIIVRSPDTTVLVPEPPATTPANVLAGFVSNNTKRAYARDLKDFFRTDDLTTLSIQSILKVRPEDVGAFRDRLMAANMKPSTVARKLSAIRSLYNNLIARGLIQVNPADPVLVRSPKRPTIRKAGYLSWEDICRILSMPDRQTEMGKRDYAALLLASNTGLRRSELCNLKDEDVRKDAGRWGITVRGKGGKERRIPIRDKVMEALEEWKKVRPQGARWLFTTMNGERLKEHDFWKLVKKYAQMAGLEDRVHPHAFRAAFIAFLDSKGTPTGVIQQLTGHSRGDTTLAYIRELDLMRSGVEKKLEGLDGEAK